MTPREAKVWYTILKRLYPYEDIEWCLKKAAKSGNCQCLQKPESQSDAQWKQSNVYKKIWKNIKIGFVSFWFQQSNCNFTQQQIRILMSHSFGHLKSTASVLQDDVNNQLLNFTNGTLKKLMAEYRSKELMEIYQKRYIPPIKLEQLQRIWANPHFSDQQIRAFCQMEPVELDESIASSLDMFGMNVASFLSIYYRNAPPSAGQL